jgi:hypothetical protein
MNEDLDKQLRAALRPVNPEEGFSDRVMARIHAGHRPARRGLPSWFPDSPPWAQWVRAALAASAILGAGLHAWHVHQERRERQGLQARQQLMDALRVTGDKLDLAYRVVNAESDDSGA